MARIMVVQCSGRRNGYTANLMKAAVGRIRVIVGVDADVHHLHDYTVGPCTSCFSCIRNVGGGCVLDDDWGRKGEGPLYRAFKRANALLMVDPVHSWGISAAAHAFMERIYPTFWEGTPYGLPFASISCASNQGFQHRATQDYCKFASGYGFRYVGGLPVHAVHYNESLEEAKALAGQLAAAALEDEGRGRKKLSDREIFTLFSGTAWDLVEEYLRNVTMNTFSYEDSLPVKAERENLVTDSEAVPLFEQVRKHLLRALDAFHAGDSENAAVETAMTAKYWTNATFHQCCKNLTVDTDMPKTYRPLDETT